MTVDSLPAVLRESYEIHEWRHAVAILQFDFPGELQDICEVLGAFRLQKSHIAVGGGRKSKVAELIDHALAGRGWREKRFRTKITVDTTEMESPTHAVDCFKNGVALEIEWNNKTRSLIGISTTSGFFSSFELCPWVSSLPDVMNFRASSKNLAEASPMELRLPICPSYYQGLRAEVVVVALS